MLTGSLAADGRHPGGVNGVVRLFPQVPRPASDD